MSLSRWAKIGGLEYPRRRLRASPSPGRTDGHEHPEFGVGAVHPKAHLHLSKQRRSRPQMGVRIFNLPCSPIQAAEAEVAASCKWSQAEIVGFPHGLTVEIFGA